MKLNRAAFIQHLQRIRLGGLIPEAVFSGAFETTALTKDQLLIVFAPGLPKVEELSEEIGIADLEKLKNSLSFLSGSGSEGTDVMIDVEGFRLVIDEGHRGILRLLTAAPSTIGTRMKEETVEKVKAVAPSEDGIPLGKALVEGVCATFKGFKAEEVEIQIDAKGGKIVVGNENADISEFDLGIKGKKGREEYTLLFGKHLIEVFSILTNFDEAKLFLGGPSSMVKVQDGAYEYIMSPRSRGSE